MAIQAYQHLLDTSTQLKDAGLVAADAAAQVGGSAAVVDLGTGYHEFDVVIDWTACEVATGDELYEVQVQVADETAFDTTKFIAGRVRFGDSSVTGNQTDTPAQGRYVITCNNGDPTIGQPTQRRYVRLYTDVNGTIATGFNYRAWLVPKQ